MSVQVERPNCLGITKLEVLEPELILTAKQLEKIAWLEKEGFERGFNRGHDEGLKKAAQNVEQKELELQNLIENFQTEAQKLINNLAPLIKDLSLNLAKALCRVELSLHPEQVKQVVDECLHELPRVDETITLRIHPEDAIYCQIKNKPSMTIVPDETLSRGGCILQSQLTEIDASLERRLEALIEHFRGL